MSIKISALPAATFPLGGGEVLPIVQAGATNKVSVDELRNYIASELDTGAFHFFADSTPALYFVVTGGTGGVEVIELFSFVPPSATFLGLPIVFLVTTQTNPGDQVQFWLDGAPTANVGAVDDLASLTAGTVSYSDIRLTAVGQGVAFVWDGNAYKIWPGITAGNFSAVKDPGDVAIFAAPANAGTNNPGGELDLGAGNGDGTGKGGDVVINAGPAGLVNAVGGAVNVLSGAGQGTGNGGDVNLFGAQSGNGAGSRAGDVTLSGGLSLSTGRGGNISMQAGISTGGGAPGNIQITGLPTADPGISGALWVDVAGGRVLKVSA